MTVCALLVGTAWVFTLQSLALAADGSFQLTQVLGTGEVYGLDARILAAFVHQSAVVMAARAGVTDTHVFSVLLGIGQLVVPAIVWSIAILLSRRDRLVFAAVAMTAGLCAGTTWFISVSEVVLAVPLTVVVSVLLWLPRGWRWGHVALASTASVLLVASYETAVLTGAVLAVWAGWRAAASRSRPDRYGSAFVAAASILSVAVALSGVGAGRNPTHAQSFLYFVVSLEPWPFYVALAGLAALIAAMGPWLDGIPRRFVLGSGCAAIALALSGLEPSAVVAFEARGGATVAGFILQLFLWWRWIQNRPRAETCGQHKRGGGERTHLLVAVPIALVALMVAVNIQPARSWSRSLDAFRSQVNAAHGVVAVDDVLPPDRRAVLWEWTSSSMSLIVRRDVNAGILVDRNPSLVPFPPDSAREQLADKYTWRK